MLLKSDTLSSFHLKNEGKGETYDISSFPAPYNTKIPAAPVAPAQDKN